MLGEIKKYHRELPNWKIEVESVFIRYRLELFEAREEF